MTRSGLSGPPPPDPRGLGRALAGALAARPTAPVVDATGTRKQPSSADSIWTRE